MNISPLDIQQKRFHTTFRGYDTKEVDSFLDQVRQEMEDLLREVTELREFRQIYDQRMSDLKDREDTVKNTMIVTQKLAEDMKEHARREAAVIVKDTEIRSQKLLASAQEDKHKLEIDIQDLKRKKHHFIQDIRKVVAMHLEMVNFEESGNEKPNEKPVEPGKK